MTTIKMNAVTNDFDIVNNAPVMIGGADEVAQRVRARLRMFRGEWFLDLTRGTPYFQVIFLKGVALDIIAAAIKREILSTAGVLELLEYTQTVDKTTRKLSVNFKIRVTDGTVIEISEAIG